MTSSISSSSNTQSQQHHKNTKNDTNNTQPQILKNTVPEPQKSNMKNGVHTSDDLILQSRQVAVKGNQLAQTNDYTGAVEMFSKAISLDPTDFRFVNTIFFRSLLIGKNEMCILTSNMEKICESDAWGLILFILNIVKSTNTIHDLFAKKNNFVYLYLNSFIHNLYFTQ